MKPALFLSVFFLIAAPAQGDDPAAFFESRVRPLLLKKCGECHGKEDPEGKLTLTSVEGIAAGGASGPTVVPEQLDRSRLIQAIRYTAKLKMPPDTKLPAEDIAILEKWVRDGAVLPGAKIEVRKGNSSGEFTITDEDRNWWAFQPIRVPVPPHVEARDRVLKPVDRFVLRRLEEKGLTLSPPADRQTILRRITFDLTGLPPTLDEIDAFLNDDSPDAYERLVERLLASPGYGVRWGRHWLDVARYADTNGGGFDYVYPNAWRYRDYVVRSFNADKPYDQFLVEQLAGDLLPVEPDCSEDEYVDRLTATGLLTLAPKGLGMQDKEQMILDVVDDQIDVLGRSLIGLTLSCARCHDHKFDPISTADYYALAGIFRSTTSLIDTDKNPSYWPERPLESPSVTASRKAWLARKAANEKAIANLKQKANAAVIEAAKKRLPEYLLAAVRLCESAAGQGAVAHWAFDEAEGDVTKARSGTVASLANAKGDDARPVRIDDGKLGRALKFAEQRDTVSLQGKEPSLQFGKATDFTVSLWLRAAPGYSPKTADTILSVRYPSALWFIALRPGGFNGLYLRHYDGKRAVDIKPTQNRLPLLTDGRWHHLAFTSDRDGSGRVYLDGEKAGEVPIATISQAANFAGPISFQIGPSVNQFRGDLDDLAIWQRVLGPGEIKALFTAASAEPPRNVTELERSRPKPDVQFTLADVAKQGLIPDFAQRLASLLTEAEVDGNSPLRPLIDSPPTTQAQAEEFVRAAGEPLAKLLANKKTNPFQPGSNIASFYDEASTQRLAKLTAEANAIRQGRIPDASPGMVAFDSPKPADLRVLIAGDRMNPGEVAPRGFPQILNRDSRAPSIKDGSGRLELARWLTAPNHPLTARVFVNRVWQHHFGEGLVPTPDNFGRLGEKPSHPELLDWLASKFIRDGWPVKSLHREIVLSAAYRQSSRLTSQNKRGLAVDSGNRLLWRMNRRRLESEPIRDAMLAASGQLDLRLEGTVNSWKPKIFSVDDANAETANYKTNRRSIYLPVVRGAALHEMLQLFDFGDPNSITPRRATTTVPPQVLFLFNSPFVRDQAAPLAKRINDTGGSLPDRIRLAYRLTLSRLPTETELTRSESFLKSDSEVDWNLFCQMLLCLNEFAYID